MILKVADPISDHSESPKWVYFADVARVAASPRWSFILTRDERSGGDHGIALQPSEGFDKPAVKGGRYRSTEYLYAADNEIERAMSEDGGPDVHVLVLDVHLKEGPVVTLATTGEAFLVNDQGKTIERL